MPTVKELIEDLNYLSERISTQVRTVALGALVVTWGLLIGEGSAPKAVVSAYGSQIIAIGLVAVIVMFLDFLQYVCGYVLTRKLYKKVSDEKRERDVFDTESFWYRARGFLFWFKSGVLAVVVVWLVIVLGLVASG